MWMYQNEKEEAKKAAGSHLGTTKKLTKWPDWEEARKLENGEWRLEPEGEAEVPEIIIASDCGGRHFRGPSGRMPVGGAEGKAPERVEAVERSWSE